MLKNLQGPKPGKNPLEPPTPLPGAPTNDINAKLLEMIRNRPGLPVGPEVSTWTPETMQPYGPPAPPPTGPKAKTEFLGNWDYKNPQKLGPNNEPLPAGAEGWTPYGTPDYGPGIAGWWKGLKANLSAPFEDVKRPTFDWAAMSQESPLAGAGNAPASGRVSGGKAAPGDWR